MLFAIDAAHKLGEQGEDDAGAAGATRTAMPEPAWTYGRDPYPPRSIRARSRASASTGR